MATIIERTWTSRGPTGHKVRRVAYGHALQVNGRQGRKVDAQYPHTCASWLVTRERSLKEVQEILGHREFSIALWYVHLSPDRLRDAVATLETFSTKSARGAKIEPACRVSSRPRSSGG